MGELHDIAGAEFLGEDKPTRAGTVTVAIAEEKLVKARRAFIESRRWVQNRGRWVAVGPNGKLLEDTDFGEEVRQLWPKPPPQTSPSTIVWDASFRADAEKSLALRSFMNSVDEHARRYGISEEALEAARRNEARLEAFNQAASKKERGLISYRIALDSP